MVEVELDQTEAWGEDQDWQALSEQAVAEAFNISSYGNLASAAFTLSLSINLSDNNQVQALNAQWRGKDKPTNVLSFPMLERDALDALLSPLPFRGGDGGGGCRDSSASVDKPHPNPSPEGEGLEVLLGDLILAHEVCVSEAAEKGIPLADHATHLIIHGTLHLLGYDHIDDADAEQMEALEVKALASLGLPNPY